MDDHDTTSQSRRITLSDGAEVATRIIGPDRHSPLSTPHPSSTASSKCDVQSASGGVRTIRGFPSSNPPVAWLACCQQTPASLTSPVPGTWWLSRRRRI
ncbi:hypothetical protein [Brevibacterium atlanticum]|uniref:hypothetical protein n=1 Tax=Brevibacterium atlanticum TaxID=2697563 RepID=UPI0014211718|nr:hypothetical protein [Brevibacterium atlanticum]